MNKPAKFYSSVVIALGAIAVAYSVYQYGLTLVGVQLAEELEIMFCLVLLCTICRSLPIFINRNFALDVSILSIVAAVLAHGIYAAVVVCLISSLFTVEYNERSKTRQHLFNTPIIKTLFNNSALVLAILLPGLLIVRMGFVPGELRLPNAIWPMAVFTLLTFVVNYFIVLGMLLLNKLISPDNVMSNFLSLLPNVIAAMPLGLLTGFLFTSENGNWMAVIMLLPLLLARYAWKLYLDSQRHYYRLINAFVSSMEAKDEYTEGHSRRVNQYAVLIGKGLGLKPRQMETLKVAALLHDIGKIGITDNILQKPSRLDDEEFAQIKSHPEIGVGIVERVGLPKDVVEIIRHHHERYDGAGYPDGLPAARISLASQILIVADAYDAMTSSRPYREALPREVAFQELRNGKGNQFNPELVDVLIEQLITLGESDLPDGDVP